MTLNPGNCNKPDDFIARYQELLEHRTPSRILEIGVQWGDSIRMWANAFPKAQVVGLDTQAASGVFPANVQIVSGDQGDVGLLTRLGSFDFIVDDGSHMSQDQQTSFETLFPRLASGGLYVIEDLEPHQQERFKNSPYSTLEYFAQKLATVTVGDSLAPVYIHEGMKSITFADNLLVIEKV